MQIVETHAELQEVLAALEGPVLVLPVFRDHRAHPAINTLSVLVVYSPDAGRCWCLPIDHNDSPAHWPLHVLDKARYVYGPRSLAFLWPKLRLRDICWTDAHYNGRPKSPEEFYTPIMRQRYARFEEHPNLNETIPLMPLLGYLDAYRDHLAPLMEAYTSTFHNEIVVPVLTTLERAGIQTTEGLVYSEYNPYTLTGRITNAQFGGLSKSDGSRKALISRFPNGKLIHIDYEAFHLRLIGKLLDCQLPPTSLHMWLAEQYFHTSQPTKEQYAAAKTMTFEIIYGATPVPHIPFLQAIDAFRDAAWTEIQQSGVYSTMHNEIRLSTIDNPSKEKVFNYILQALEMETAMGALHNVLPLYHTAHSKVVLYTYDAILIDWSPDDDDQLLLDTIHYLTNGGEFPVRLMSGPNYHEMMPMDPP